MEPNVNIDQPKPQNLKDSHVEHIFKLRASDEASVSALQDKAWKWLNSKQTFENGQIFPFRVEFVSEGVADAPFAVGTYTNHHGPLLNANGLITQMQPKTYRELRYFYGSYVLSFRAIRPVALEFWLQPEPFSGTQEAANDCLFVKVKMRSYVHPWVFGPFESILKYFWKRFEFWMRDSLTEPKKISSTQNPEADMETNVQKISQACDVCGKELNYDAISVKSDEAFEAQVSHVNHIYKIEETDEAKKCIKNRSVLLCDKVGCSVPHVMVVQNK